MPLDTSENVALTVPFLSPDNNSMNHQQKVVRPIWLKYGENVLPTSNIAFEMKQTRTAIGESYLLTNAIFSSVAEEIDITFERNSQSQSGFLFGVKSELDSGRQTDKMVFAREMETSIQRPLTCMIDFSSFGKHGRCLIPDATFEHISSSFKEYTSNCIRLKLLKRGDNIFINFGFVKSKAQLGYHLDAQGEPWFLFCRLRTQGRIVLELGAEYIKGTIGIGRNGSQLTNQTHQRKRSTVDVTGQQTCQLARKATELSPLKSIRPVKCYCVACYVSSCAGNESLKHRRGIYFIFFYVALFKFPSRLDQAVRSRGTLETNTFVCGGET